MQGVGEHRTGAVATDDTVNCGNLWIARLLSLDFSALHSTPVPSLPLRFCILQSTQLTLCMQLLRQSRATDFALRTQHLAV